MGDAAPPCRGDFGVVGHGDAHGDGAVEDNAEHTGQGHLGRRRSGDGADVEHSADKAVAGLVGAGKHVHAADFLPVIVDGELLVDWRRIGENLILFALVDGDASVYVFDYG